MFGLIKLCVFGSSGIPIQKSVPTLVVHQSLCQHPEGIRRKCAEVRPEFVIFILLLSAFDLLTVIARNGFL